MAKNQSSIYERQSDKTGGQSTWQARLREDGVSLSKTFKNRQEAENWLILKRAKIITGESVAGEKHSDTLLPDIFDDYIRNGGIDDKKTALVNTLKLELAKVKLKQLNTRALENYIKIKLTQEIRHLGCTWFSRHELKRTAPPRTVPDSRSPELNVGV